MSDTRPAFEQFADTARLAIARGDRDGARASLEMALAHTTDGAGGETPEALIRLGTLYQEAGILDEAERLFGDAAAVAEATLGPMDASVARAFTCLGMMLVARGEHAAAEPLLTRALAIGEHQLGPDSTDLNVLLNALSRLHLRQGAFDRAEPLLERLLAMKRTKGEEHPEVATVLASLALVRQGVGDHEGAERLGRRVLQIRERTLAPNHYAIASALELLADSCAARGKVGEAVLLYKRALSIREQTLGVTHASLRVARERIADLQLQAAEETGEDLTGGLVTLTLPPAFTPGTGGALAPSRKAQVEPPPNAIAPLMVTPDLREAPSAAPVATRTEVARIPIPAARDDHFDEDARPAEQRTQALVLPASTGALSLHEALANIENDMNDAAALEAQPSRAAAFAAAAWTTLSARRTHVAVAAASIAAILLAVRIAQPRAADESSVRASTAGSAPRVNGAAGSASIENGQPIGDSGLVRTSAGSVALRSVSAPGRTSATSRDSETRSQSNSAERSEPVANLELGRTARAPLPSINLPAGDSIARVADTKVGADGFSKQFWTSAIDKKGAPEATAPRNAKLIGDMPQPFYPDFLRKNGIEGEVVVRFVVDQAGRPDISTLEVVRSPHDALTTSVRRVVERMRFEPALTGGTSPAPRTEVVQISFAFTTASK